MRRPIVVLSVIVASLALAGCWTSQKLLLDPGEGVDAARSGIYDGGSDKTRLISKGHGWYVASDGSQPEDKAMDGALPVLLAHLPGADHHLFILAAGMSKACVSDHTRCDAWVYGVVRVDGDHIDEALPDCDKTRDLALKWGAKSDGGSGDPCDFQSRDALIGALKAYIEKPGAFEQTLKRE